MSDLSHLPLYQFDLAQLQSALTGILVGADPRELNQIERRMMGFYPDEGHMYSRSGLVRQGVDLALHDCLGRADGVPVSALLGGALRDRIQVCYPVFRLRTADQVPAALDRVDDKLADGFDVIRSMSARCRGGPGVHDRVCRPVRGPGPDQVARLLEPARVARGAAGHRATDRRSRT